MVAQHLRPRRRRRILPIIFIAVGLLLLIAAGGILINAFIGYQQATDTYAALAKNAPVRTVEDESGIPAGVPEVNFDALESINSDIVGWIYLPGTNINYPVVKGEDNDEYLRRLFDGTSNASGSIFMDELDTAPGMVDQQTTLYGHHMNNRSMFWEIDETRDQANFDKLTVAYYITRDAVYECTPLLTAIVDENYAQARQSNFGDSSDLVAYLQDLNSRATARADNVDERISSAERVVDFITCSSEWITSDRTVMVLTVDRVYPNT